MDSSKTDIKAQYWNEHFTAWEASGLSQVEYCKQHNLKLANFTYWRTRSNKTRRKFMPLSSPAVSERLILDLPHGIRLELPMHTLVDVLPTVLRSLRDAG